MEDGGEDYQVYPDDDNMILLAKNKNIIGLEDYLSNNITDHTQILNLNTGTQLSVLLSEMTNIKVEDEIVDCTLKEETESHLLDAVLFEEDTNYVNDIQLTDYIKDEEIEFCESTDGKHFKTEIYDTRASEIKIEEACVNICIKYENKFLSCDHCNEDYEDYCIKCQMLIYILNGNTLHNIDNKAENGIPNNFVEIKESFGHRGIYTLKYIPEDVKFGPFTGLRTSEGSLKIKGGRFVVDNDKLQFLNWMQFINSAQNIVDHNLVVFQNEDDIYYRSTREIQEGEELQVYFGEEYEISKMNGIEMDFIPTIETDIKDVFACTLCCLGFNTMVYLNKHKTVCPNNTSDGFSNKDIMQCPYCKIYLEQWEYLKYHISRCSDKNDRQCVLPTYEDQMLASSTQDKQHEPYKSDPLEHYETETTYDCSICYQRFKRKRNLKQHVTNGHANAESTAVFRCFLCEYETNSTCELKQHFKRNHIKDGKYKCTKCTFETKYKYNLKVHFDTHKSVKGYKCAKCDCATNYEHCPHRRLAIRKARNQYKCSKCEYTTSVKRYLERHAPIHDTIKQFKCSKCDYATSVKWYLVRHALIHDKKKQFKCSKCDYATSVKRILEKHALIHDTIKQCWKCDYATNKESKLQQHLRTHETFKQFKCSKVIVHTFPLLMRGRND